MTSGTLPGRTTWWPTHCRAVAATPQTLDYAAIAEAQRDCPSIQAAGDSSLSLQLVPFGTVRVLCDNKGRHPRPVIPLGHRRQVFDAFHGMVHPAARVTKTIMGQRVTWSCMNKDVTQWVKDCQTCSRAKVTASWPTNCENLR